jgi:hypothetical protein
LDLARPSTLARQSRRKRRGKQTGSDRQNDFSGRIIHSNGSGLKNHSAYKSFCPLQRMNRQECLFHRKMNRPAFAIRLRRRGPLLECAGLPFPSVIAFASSSLAPVGRVTALSLSTHLAVKSGDTQGFIAAVQNL